MTGMRGLPAFGVTLERMHRIWYANTSFLTDDRTASAVMEYARVLAIVNSADVIGVPGIDATGEVRAIQLVIGPSSQILAAGTDDEHVDVRSDEAVEELARRADQRLPRSDDIVNAGLPPEDDLATPLDDGSGSAKGLRL